MTDVRSYRFITAALAILYTIHFAMTPMEQHFIDFIDLVIHEAGHTICVFFGDFIRIAAGSGFQVLFPILFCFYFFKTRQYFASSIMLLWLGVNLLNISIYAGDAIVMQLPLLGGDAVGHDWNNLLSMTGTLKYTPQIAGTIWTLGIISILAGSVLSLWFAYTTKSLAQSSSTTS